MMNLRHRKQEVNSSLVVNGTDNHSKEDLTLAVVDDGVWSTVCSV